mmetsp:Transcript_9674/g.17018  ORF Transcript_9674/g.17018 Transcript_9674/m.17018 type:complete len:370 (-) Transcript_9674:122-1231(-)
MYTALDSSFSAERGAEKLQQARLSSDADLRQELTNESDLFKAGRVFQKNRETRITQEAYLKLLQDLKSSEQTSLQLKETRYSTVDFIAGRLFEHFAAGPDRSLPNAMCLVEEQFLALVKRTQLEDKLFVLGRLFERYAVARPKLGLLAFEFQSFCRDPSIGQTLLHIFKERPGLLEEDEELEEETGRKEHEMDRAAAAQLNDLAKALNQLMSKQEQRQPKTRESTAKPEWQSNLDSERISRQSSDNECAQAEDMQQNVNRIQRLDKQVAAYEAELGAEVALKTELPEAFSAAKEKLLQDHIDALKAKRHSALKTLQRFTDGPKRNIRETWNPEAAISPVAHLLPSSVLPPSAFGTNFYPPAEYEVNGRF